MRPPFFACLGALLLAVGWVARADAQVYEAVGTRAQGMGAFVAVADDATAAWWNPAGLATGKLFSLAVEHGQTNDPSQPQTAGPARRDTASGFSAAFPALAVSYYHLRVSEIAPAFSTGVEAPGRQDPGTGVVRLRALSANQFGVSVGQSLGDHLVIGSTLKLVSAGRAETVAMEGPDLLDRTDDLDVEGDTTTDLDIGAMAAFGPARLGVTLKHLRAPTFGKDSVQFVMERQARAGVAFLAQKTGPVDAITVAADMDLTSTITVNGDVRHFATGVEMWLIKRHLGVRSGISMNTVGERKTTGSAGVSLGGVWGLYFDAAILFGSDQARNGLNIGASMTF